MAKLFYFILISICISSCLSSPLSNRNGKLSSSLGKCNSHRYRFWNLASSLVIGLTYPIKEQEECKIDIISNSHISITGYGINVDFEFTTEITKPLVASAEGFVNNTLVILIFMADDRSSNANNSIPDTKVTITCLDVDCDIVSKRQNIDNLSTKNELIIVGSCVTCVDLNVYPNSLYGFKSANSIIARPYSGTSGGYTWRNLNTSKRQCDVDTEKIDYYVCDKKSN
ncbi:hypothetical protein DpV83gp017 [Deerpox virus W-848-83]|uniref:Early protein OPG038 n=1 Tax=Deerpox virus (strain Mule deer/United States/W-848-83/1983) TaxID=305674 RepID=Q08FY3_DPV83|nr:hypothetical protein DpV83gp017 [Deerpox virus W-848-83]ABI99174.1 hypothetical protein DpV83gp017 [Deerpox virus W-848-83]